MVLIVVIIVAFQPKKPPPLTKSCTTPAFALSKTEVAEHDAVQWSATGPSGMVFELTLGVERFDVSADGTLVAVPENGADKSHAQQASRQITMPESCTTDALFGVVVPPGHYTVKMFRLTGTRTAPHTEEVASKPFTVTAK